MFRNCSLKASGKFPMLDWLYKQNVNEKKYFILAKGNASTPGQAA